MNKLPIVTKIEMLNSQVKQVLWAGGIQRANAPEGRLSTPGLQKWQDLVRVQKFNESPWGCLVIQWKIPVALLGNSANGARAGASALFAGAGIRWATHD